MGPLQEVLPWGHQGGSRDVFQGDCERVVHQLGCSKAGLQAVAPKQGSPGMILQGVFLKVCAQKVSQGGHRRGFPMVISGGVPVVGVP